MRRSILFGPVLALAVLGACGGANGGGSDGSDAVVPADGVYTGRDDFRMVVTSGEVVSLFGACDDPTGAEAVWPVAYGEYGRTAPLAVKPPSEPVRFSVDGEPWFGDDYHFSTPWAGTGEESEVGDRPDPPLVWALNPAAFDGTPRTKDLAYPMWDGTFSEDGRSVSVNYHDFDWADWVGIDVPFDDPMRSWSCWWNGTHESSS